jgi:hypothetical protein
MNFPDENMGMLCLLFYPTAVYVYLFFLLFILGIKCAMAYCNAQTVTKVQMLSHYRIIHRGDHAFDVPCLAAGCDKRYRTEDGLRKHLKNQHRTFFAENHFEVELPAGDAEEDEEETQCQNSSLMDALSPTGASSILSTEECISKPHN